jgi:hypothetical protein
MPPTRNPEAQLSVIDDAIASIIPGRAARAARTATPSQPAVPHTIHRPRYFTPAVMKPGAGRM